jgi:peptidyl-prolyl cis-trans isomerase C
MRRLVLLLAACGGSTQPPPPMPSGPPAPMVAPGTGSDDVIVATVNGRPVWGSCVSAQHSLDDCIGFELMAQEAQKRGLDRDPDVALGTRTAMVSQLVAKEYEAKFTHPGDFGDVWQRLVEKQRYRWDHPEVRSSFYVRFSDQATAEKVAAAAAKQTGWMSPMLYDLAKQTAGNTDFEHADVPPKLARQLEDHYGAALYAIPAVGSTSPATHTQWGWDVILYSDVLPETHLTDQQLMAEVLQEVQRSFFSVWVHQLELAMNLHVEEHPEGLEALPP